MQSLAGIGTQPDLTGFGERFEKDCRSNYVVWRTIICIALSSIPVLTLLCPALILDSRLRYVKWWGTWPAVTCQLCRSNRRCDMKMRLLAISRYFVRRYKPCLKPCQDRAHAATITPSPIRRRAVLSGYIEFSVTVQWGIASWQKVDTEFATGKKISCSCTVLLKCGI